jgi:translation initiation factor IF-2
MMPSGKLITFLDTPGHAAFLDMRRRGANMTDIVILVVAADDSVKPQTVEAIKHAKEAGVPMIVAINKVDKPDINIQKVKQDLARHNVNIEDFGGDVQTVPVSGKTGHGMLELEEATVALAEMLDLRGDPEGNVEGWVVEATTKNRGRVATVLVKRGILRAGQVVVAGKTWARIRSLKNEAGVPIEEATPGTPVEIDGWREQPIAGAEVLEAPSEQRAKDVVEMRIEREESEKLRGDMTAINESRRAERDKRQQELSEEEESVLKQAAEESETSEESASKEIPFIIKADVSGSVEAILNSVSSVGNHEVYPKILRSGVGAVSEFDIKHAAIGKGMVVSFNQPVDQDMLKLARAEGVQILDHTIIYELIDDVKTKLSDYLAPTITLRVLGEAEIAQVFEIKLKRKETALIAGCRVKNGVVGRNHKVKVFRGDEVIYDGKQSLLSHLTPFLSATANLT